MKIIRYIRWFDKEDDSLKGEIEFSCDICYLRSIFNVDDDYDDLMYACWPIMDAHQKIMEDISGIKLRLDLYDYFIDVDAIE